MRFARPRALPRLLPGVKMLLKNWCLAVAGLCLLGGCADSEPDAELVMSDASVQNGAIPTQGGDAAVARQDGAVAVGDASQPGQPGNNSDAGQSQVDASNPIVVPDTFDYELEQVTLTSDL